MKSVGSSVSFFHHISKNVLPMPVYIVGIAVDGGSEVSSVKPIVTVKRSGKVVELEQDVNGMNYATFICS